MATLAVTLPKGSNAGALLRRLASQAQRMAADLPDANPTGADVVLTIDNAPAAGSFSLQITAGPVTTGVFQI